jgi:hypothetical protein
MFRVLVIVVLSVSCYLLAIGTATHIGRSQLVPVALARLHLTDCTLPCWIGIELGQTSRLEARERILAVFAKADGFQTVRDSYSEPLNVAILSFQSFDEPAQMVDFILFTGRGLAVSQIIITSSVPLTLGDFHALLGVPRCVSLRRAFPLIYADGYLRVEVRKGTRLVPDQPVTRIDLSFDSELDQECIPWQGFTRLRRYGSPT